MRARLWAVLSMAALVTAGCGTDEADPETARAAADAHDDDSHTSAGTDLGTLPDQLAATRLATAKYVTDLALAQADGYQVITPMMADMGVHYLNPAITDFDPGRPPILLYVPTPDGLFAGMNPLVDPFNAEA